MRTAPLLAVLVGAIVIASCNLADARNPFAPRGSQLVAPRLQLREPTLPPFGYTRFCLRYVTHCAVTSGANGAALQRSPGRRRAQLQEVNAAVNASIAPLAGSFGFDGDVWLIEPQTGDCNDYAVTKRHRLLAQGWSAASLLLAEVAIDRNQHHLVLVVRTDSEDLVLDNLTHRIVPWTETPYRWVRVQLPANAGLWATLSPRGGRGS